MIENIKSICVAAGYGLEDIVKITIFLTDLGNFAKVNEVMTEHFSEPYPEELPWKYQAFHWV